MGATDQETEEPLPGDELIANADLTATRAITIRASADQVGGPLAAGAVAGGNGDGGAQAGEPERRRPDSYGGGSDDEADAAGHASARTTLMLK